MSTRILPGYLIFLLAIIAGFYFTDASAQDFKVTFINPAAGGTTACYGQAFYPSYRIDQSVLNANRPLYVKFDSESWQYYKMITIVDHSVTIMDDPFPPPFGKKSVMFQIRDIDHSTVVATSGTLTFLDTSQCPTANWTYLGLAVSGGGCSYSSDFT